MWNNKNFMLIDKIDNYINIAEEDLDFIKSKLIEYLENKDFDANNTSLRKKDIYDFLVWYESNDICTQRISLIRCKQIINFIFYNKLSE